MAIYRLGNMVNVVAGGDPPQAAAQGNVVNTQEGDSSTSAPFILQAQVAQVYGYGCMVYVNGALLYADQATDEPLQAGQMVYLSQVQSGGYIIHGSVKS